LPGALPEVDGSIELLGSSWSGGLHGSDAQHLPNIPTFLRRIRKSDGQLIPKKGKDFENLQIWRHGMIHFQMMSGRGFPNRCRGEKIARGEPTFQNGAAQQKRVDS